MSSFTLSSNLPSRSARATYQDCLVALLNPTAMTYKLLGQRRSSVWRAYSLVFASSLIGGVIASLVPLEVELAAQSTVDILLLALIPVTALICVCSLAAFAWCAQSVARVFKGSAVYGQLAYVLAVISAPLLIVACIIDLIPAAHMFLVVLYFYWLAQYVMAIRAVNGLSLVKAIAAVLFALLMLSMVWLGVAFLVSYTGILLQ